MGILSRSIIGRGMKLPQQHTKLWKTRRLTPSGGHRQQHYHGTPSVSLARILCTDNIDPICPEILSQNGHTADTLPTLAPKDLASIIAEYDGLIVRSATEVTPELLKNAPNLKIVGRAGVGIDNIDVAACTKAGVLVMNTPGGNTVSTAQLALSLLCTAARRISEGNMSMKEGKWERKKFTGVELTGKTIGIVGCGRIGQQVGEWAKRVGMNVVGYDPVLSAEGLESVGIERMDLSDLWGVCDFVTVHTPLSSGTRGIINDNTIAKMKKGVIVVNCARGGIVDEAALLRGLESGQVGGAALDVYSSEPPHEDKVLKALVKNPLVVCTPHLGASTEEAQVNVARGVASQMSDTLAGIGYAGVVNVRYMAMAHESGVVGRGDGLFKWWFALQPYMEIAEIIGRLQSQVLKGIMLFHPANKLISGSVFGKNGTIVQIDSYKDFPAFKPEGVLLSFRNEDVLSAAGLNVGRMNVGRQSNDLALCLVDLDQLPSSETIDSLRKLKTLHDVGVSIVS